MKYLLIVESPSKCAKIESFLPCQCISSKGHIRELNKLPKKGGDPIFEIIEEKKTHIESMRKVIKKYSADQIYLASDDDREGEAIAWHICQVFGLPVETTKRIIFHEITKGGLEKAISSPTLINMSLVRAQQARQVVDMMVGFKISPVLWKYLYRSKDNCLSAGRCQTPALRLVYDNAQEKKDITMSYRISGLFYPKKIEFVLSRELDTKEEVVGFLEASKGFLHKFSIGVKKSCIEGAPKPFHTSGLLQAASSSLKMSPKEVMAGCQMLYQAGHITYMRTDSRLYCGEFLREVRGFITSGWSESYVGSLGGLESTDAGNPHEAIRVTHLEMKSVEGFQSRVAKLYEFIWKNTVASCMSGYRGEQTPLYFTSPLTDCPYVYKVETPIFWGWKTLFTNIDTTTKEQATGAGLMLYMQSCKKEVICELVSAKVAIHGRHSHYTEASLISKLEDKGIGRPSTYASLVDTIIERGYVKKMDIDGSILNVKEYVLENKNGTGEGTGEGTGKGTGEIIESSIEKKVGQEKGKLVIQPVGIMVIEFLTNHFDKLFAYDYTKGMELDLDEIALGGTKDICSACDAEIDELIIPTEKMRFRIKDTCEYFVVFGRYGPMVQKEGSRESLSICKDIDIGRLQRCEYNLDELLVNKEERVIGEYEGKSVIMKTGPYGFYLQYNDENIGYKTLGIEDGEESDIYDIFVKYKSREGSMGEQKKVIRELTEEMSIRNGKYGAYVHYHKPGMKKPKFLTLKGFKESYRLCHKDILMEWIKTTYGL